MQAGSVETEQQAAAALGEVRKEHYNARHNCFAMILGANRNFEKAGRRGAAGNGGRADAGSAAQKRPDQYPRGGHAGISAERCSERAAFVRLWRGSVRGAPHRKKGSAYPGGGLRLRIDYADYGKLQSIAAEYGAKVEADYGEKVEARAVFRQADYDAKQKNHGSVPRRGCIRKRRRMLFNGTGCSAGADGINIFIRLGNFGYGNQIIRDE